MKSGLLLFSWTLFIGRRGALLTLHPQFSKHFTLHFGLSAERKKDTLLSKRLVNGGINFTFDVHLR